MATKLYFNDVDSDFEYSVVLDSLEYILRFTWNSTSETWQMTVKDYEGEVLVAGVRVVSEFPLTYIYKSLGGPSGYLYVVQNKEGPLQTPSRYSFRDGIHSLWYLTEDEVNEISS